MAREDRMGNRKPRQQRLMQRVPDLGYYLIVTDTEGTERCYFNGLHDDLPADIKDRLVIKVIETSTAELIEKCLEYTAYNAQYREPWIIFDRDQVKNFDHIIELAFKNQINVGWSNPCFEIWMHAYYGYMPSIENSWNCCSKFSQLYEKKTGQKYDKADATIYKRLKTTGDEDKAIRVAELRLKEQHDLKKGKPSEMCPCTTVHMLVYELRGKANI